MKKIVLGAVIVLFASWVLLPVTGLSKPEYSKKEGNVPCAKCHVKPIKGDENLNDTGKCYKEKKSLSECEKK